MNYEEAQKIPGMIEPNERKMLYEQAKQISLNKEDCVVEFGAFFGRSTNCIAQGLSANPSFTSKCLFYTYDSFECDIEGWFAPHVKAYAKEAKVLHLVKDEGNRVDFESVFKHYLQPYIDSKLLVSVKSELLDSQPPENSIALMHIDSPKYYEEFKIILYRFFPKVKLHCTVIFQDFFYHWSGSLILVVAILIEKNFISLECSAASSLVTKVLRSPTKEDILEIDLIMQNHGKVSKYFDIAIKECSKIQIDRNHQFLPRLTLAKIQWLYSQKRFSEAKFTLQAYLKEGNAFNKEVVWDFIEIFSHGFSLRKLFEIDHDQG